MCDTLPTPTRTPGTPSRQANIGTKSFTPPLARINKLIRSGRCLSHPRPRGLPEPPYTPPFPIRNLGTNQFQKRSDIQPIWWHEGRRSGTPAYDWSFPWQGDPAMWVCWQLPRPSVIIGAVHATHRAHPAHRDEPTRLPSPPWYRPGPSNCNPRGL